MSKYHAQKIKNEDGVFDSKKEWLRYIQLKTMEECGQISDLRRQVEYELIPPQQGKYRKERGVKYTADFVYIDNNTGEEIVEDVKGLKTKDYVLRRKMMLYFKKIDVYEWPPKKRKRKKKTEASTTSRKKNTGKRKSKRG